MEAVVVKMEPRFKMGIFFPSSHVALKSKAPGRKDAHRWEIYHGPAFPENWIGDIVYWEDTQTWDAQSHNGTITNYEYPNEAAEAILRNEKGWSG